MFGYIWKNWKQSKWKGRKKVDRKFPLLQSIEGIRPRPDLPSWPIIYD
jgi:hypothetical protein